MSEDEGDEEARLQRPANSDMGRLTWSVYILCFLTYTLESLASASLGGWGESHWEILLRQCMQLLDLASPLRLHCYLFCLFYCERGVVKSSKKWSALHQGRHTRHHCILLVALLSPFMEVEKRMRKPPAFLGSCGTAGNRLASGISVQGRLGGVSEQALGD